LGSFNWKIKVLWSYLHVEFKDLNINVYIKYFKSMKILHMAFVLLMGNLIACSNIEGNIEQSEMGIYKDSEPISFIDLNNELNSSASKDSVMICKSKSAFAYHLDYCTGLKRCKSKVVKMSLSEAKLGGYKPCGFCYN
jgi:hypothetical protein